MKRYCLEKCDEEGKKGDYELALNNSRISSNSDVDRSTGNINSNSESMTNTNSSNTIVNKSNDRLETATAANTVSAPSYSSTATFRSSPAAAPAECESEFDGIIAAMESALSPLWAEDVDEVSTIWLLFTRIPCCL